MRAAQRAERIGKAESRQCPSIPHLLLLPRLSKPPTPPQTSIMPPATAASATTAATTVLFAPSRAPAAPLTNALADLLWVGKSWPAAVRRSVTMPSSPAVGPETLASEGSDVVETAFGFE